MRKMKVSIFQSQTLFRYILSVVMNPSLLKESVISVQASFLLLRLFARNLAIWDRVWNKKKLNMCFHSTVSWEFNFLKSLPYFLPLFPLLNRGQCFLVFLLQEAIQQQKLGRFVEKLKQWPNPSHVIEMASLILLCVPGQCGDNCPAVQTSSLM